MPRRVLVQIIMSALMLAAPVVCQSSLRYNQIQTMGTHNSYHIAPPTSVLTFLSSPIVASLLGNQTDAVPSSWEVTMQPVQQQFENYGIRQVEMDVWADPNGTLFTTAAALKLAGGNGTLASSQYRQPGYKVMHIPDVDWQTTVILFTDALTAVSNWSVANPTHTPIAFYVEVKNPATNTIASQVGQANTDTIDNLLASESGGPPYSLIEPIDETPSDIDLLQQDILNIIGRDSIITPDDLRGNASTLQEALIGTGKSWPTLESMQGKILFVVIDDYAAEYLDQFPNLASPALMFISNTAPINPQTVFLEPADDTNTPSRTVAGQAAAVQQYVEQGYIVRVLADVDTTEARASNYTRAQAFLDAGAHILSTDFPVLPTFFNSSYALQLPTAMTCNPLTTNITGTPIFLSTDYILATSSETHDDTIPICGSGTAYPTSLAAPPAPPGTPSSNAPAAAPSPLPPAAMTAAPPPPPVPSSTSVTAPMPAPGPSAAIASAFTPPPAVSVPAPAAAPVPTPSADGTAESSPLCPRTITADGPTTASADSTPVPAPAPAPSSSRPASTAGAALCFALATLTAVLLC